MAGEKTSTMILHKKKRKKQKTIKKIDWSIYYEIFAIRSLIIWYTQLIIPGYF